MVRKKRTGTNVMSYILMISKVNVFSSAYLISFTVLIRMQSIYMVMWVLLVLCWRKKKRWTKWRRNWNTMQYENPVDEWPKPRSLSSFFEKFDFKISHLTLVIGKSLFRLCDICYIYLYLSEQQSKIRPHEATPEWRDSRVRRGSGTVDIQK